MTCGTNNGLEGDEDKFAFLDGEVLVGRRKNIKEQHVSSCWR